MAVFSQWPVTAGQRLRTAGRRLLGDSFSRDILILLLISMVAGSAIAGAVSLSANAYFSKTLTNLVGDYGEYDIIMQVREEVKDDAAIQVQKILGEVFPGARFKEGPTITGKTTFFVGLPDQYKTKQVYDNLGKTFGSVPGGAGVGVVTEPRLTIRGVPEGAKAMLMDHIMHLPGVRFAFFDGASIGVIMQSLDKSPLVSQQIKEFLRQYQVLEISFPVGSEPANPVRLGADIAADLKARFKLPYAENVSVDGKDSDMTYMVSTMMELRRFLSAYASQVTLAPGPGVRLAKGDILALPGPGNPPLIGKPANKTDILVEVTGIRGDKTGEGLIIQGDAALLGGNRAYKTSQGIVGEPVAAVSVHNPRQELGQALAEAGKLTEQIPALTRETENISALALSSLDQYSNGVGAIKNNVDTLQAAGNSIETATAGLADLDTSSLQVQLAASARTLGGLINTLQVLKLVNADVTPTINSLSSVQQNLYTLKNTLRVTSQVTEEARQARQMMAGIIAGGQHTLAVLQAVDTASARTDLNAANLRLAQVEKLNMPLISAQLHAIAASVPQLKDEEIAHSLKLIDKFIAGQVIPGERIQILTNSQVSVDAAMPVVAQRVGHNQAAVYATALGVIEPNTRGEVYRVLNEVRAVLAAMTALAITVFLLAFDHTPVMAALRSKRLAAAGKANGWRGLPAWLTVTVIARERQYGMAVGACLLTGMFILAGGGIPYLPWVGVPVLGAMLGLIAAHYADKVSPVSREEVMAGEALGLSFDEIMREIVIPGGRPGLLQKLNRRKLKFQ